MTEEKVVKLNVDSLVSNPYQPRQSFDENTLKELAVSIKKYGILNPILVRPKGDKYEIISGERRTRAAKLLNLTEIPALIINVDDDKMSEIALIDNLQRENITPVEEAATYQKILKNNDNTEQELSEMIGKSPTFITNKLKLLNLPKEIKDAIISKKISEKHARCLLMIGSEEEQKELLERIINEKMSIKELENIIKERKEEKESDNMNNGNFFPNFNNTPAANNTPASLNSMNAQGTTNEFTYQPEEQMAPTPQPMTAPIMPQPEVVPTMPTATPPIMNSEPVPAPIDNAVPTNFEVPASLPEMGVQMPQPEVAPVAPIAPEPPVIEETAPMADIPLFSAPEFNQTVEAAPIVTEQPVPGVPETPAIEPLLQPEVAQANIETPLVAPAVEAPLFNPEAAVPSVEPTPAEPTFEVPVENASPDKFTEIKTLLNNNGIEYKAYSNENGHCIIIEI